MNSSQINLAIAKFLNPKTPDYSIEESYEDDPHWNSGFYECEISFSDGTSEKIYCKKSELTKEKAGSIWLSSKIKNYYGNLNEIHKAENELTDLQHADYRCKLIEVCGSLADALCATAEQRCEAFSKSLNLWEESLDS